MLQLYGLHVSKEELFPGVVSQLGRSHELRRVDVFLSANIHIDSAIRATGVVGDSRSFLVSLSDGRFMLFSWQGVVGGPSSLPPARPHLSTPCTSVRPCTHGCG